MGKKRVLIPGGTGAMGTFLVPELIRLGYAVDVISKDDVHSDNPDLRYYQADFCNDGIRNEFLDKNYDVIINFMHYHTDVFRNIHPSLLSHTGQYFFLSSYRVYADEKVPVTEEAPRLLDVSKDAGLLASDDYAIAKCRCEDILHASGKKNWTILRPAIIYSHANLYTFKLVSLNGDLVMPRTRMGKPVVLPREAMNVHAAMTWGGDVGKMVSRLVDNPAAMGEIFTISSAEVNTWGGIAECYKNAVGLQYALASKDEFLDILSNNPEDRECQRWGLDYDRLFDRVIDNAKVLKATGLKQSDFMSIRDGLKLELEAAANTPAPFNKAASARMDAFLSKQA